jgi:hypothetical protein
MIRMTTPTSAIEAFFNKALAYVQECMLQALEDLAKEADERARSRGWDESFHDVTGNLRSSIGAVVIDHGKVFFTTEFSQVLNGSTGSAKGRQMVQSLASDYGETIAMVMVAAMDYAERVEALDSRDVIESTRIWAESEVMKRLEEARDKAVREINSWKI